MHQPGGFCQLVASGFFHIGSLSYHTTRVTLRFGNSRTILYFAPNVVPILLHRLRTLDSFTSASGKITISPTFNPFRVLVTSIFLLGFVVIFLHFFYKFVLSFVKHIAKIRIYFDLQNGLRFFLQFFTFYFLLTKNYNLKQYG